MSAIGVPTFQVSCAPSLFPRNNFRHESASLALSCLSPKLPKVCLKVNPILSRYQRAATVCLFGREGKSENGNEASPWKAIGNAMDKFRKDKSVEDLLKEQMQKQEYYTDGGSGGKNSGGDGGGGGGWEGGADGEGSRDALDEFLQAFMATISIIFLYTYILNGEEITVYTKDFIKLLFTRRMSFRLGRLKKWWKRFLKEMKEEDGDPYWLERLILRTSTRYDGPRKYRWIKRYQPELLDDFTSLPEVNKNRITRY